MATRGRQSETVETSTTTGAPDAGDSGQAQLQAERDEMERKGHWGEKLSDNAPYTLQTGPDSPNALEATIAGLKRRIEALRGSGGNA